MIRDYSIKFEKVSFPIFLQSVRDCFGYGIPDKDVHIVYDAIKLPKRSTSGSAGYDFFSPFSLDFFPTSYQVIPTGIRFITTNPDVFLSIVPRSGLGFKYGSHLSNTIGVIDSDYSQSDNEGHIMVKLAGEKQFSIEEGKAFCQGIIIPYYTVDDDDTTATRNGGFGSTGV